MDDVELGMQLGLARVRALSSERDQVREKYLLSIPEAAARLSIGRDSLYHLINGPRPLLVSIKVRGRRLIPLKAIAEFIDRQMAGVMR